MELLSMENLLLVGEGVLAVLGAAVILLRFVSPLTKSKADDKALSWVVKAQEWLLKLVLPKRLR
jgi:hypothetical protein